MTVARPAPPLKASSLAIPLLVMVFGMALAGLVAVPTYGIVWGALVGLFLVYGFRLAKNDLTLPRAALVIAAMTAFGLLTLVFMAQATVLLTPTVAGSMGVVWLVFGGVAASVGAPNADRAAKWSTALLWGLGGALVAPLASAMDLLPDSGEPLGPGPFIVAGAVAALIGGSALLSALSGVRTIAVIGSTIVLTTFAGIKVDFTIVELITDFANFAKAPTFWPPDFNWAIGEGVWWNITTWDFGNPHLPNPLIETFRIGILASVFGCLVALPIAFMASTVTAPNRLSYLLDKSFLNVIRTIPDLFWAMIFVAGIGLGPFAGVLALFFFTMAIMGKLLSETVDSVDPGPLEAARATGSSHFAAVRASVLPQVLPNYVAYALYIFEISIRASVVLGLVGAGGIGRVLEAQRVFFQFDRVLAVVIIIFVIVFAIEQISVALRRRLV